MVKMKIKINSLITVFLLCSIVGTCLAAENQQASRSWSRDAEAIYDTGFMHMLRKHPDGGICLFDMELIENDSPGAGQSEKGVQSDMIWGSNRARKILNLEDPRTHKAQIYILTLQRGKYPLEFTINGHHSQIKRKKGKSWGRASWAKLDPGWLKKGKNVIDFYCPKAKSEKQGWMIFISRADEFENGGGDPEPVGQTSYKSFDGGKNYKQSPFGPKQETAAEYSVRISLDRYVKTGWLESPVIDLWRGDNKDIVAQMLNMRKLKISIQSEVPEGTNVKYYLRKGISPSPYSDKWSAYELIGQGSSVDLDIPGKDFFRRFLQFKAVLSTENPLVSPIIKSASISADFENRYLIARHKNIYVIEVDNPDIQYPSVEWQWEPSDRGELEKLRKEENLDEVLTGARTQFEAQVRLMDYAKKRWRWVNPHTYYPEWDATSIRERINMGGGGGMCIQSNLFLSGLCTAYGWQSRLVGIDGHEVCEIWSDDYGKWVYFDAWYANHYLCDINTGKPLSMLELHNLYMDYFYPDRPTDWHNDLRTSVDDILAREDRPPIIRSSPTYHNNEKQFYKGFAKARINRMIPRTNWYEKPYPRPVAHTAGGWAWNGYISWYDERTPPLGRHSWFTDRPRDMWPDLNKTHITITQGLGNDRLFLEFETYTPNFSHYEVNTDDNGWKEAQERYTWLLVPGKNTIRVRAVNKSAVGGKPSSIVVERVLLPTIDE